MKLIDTVEMMNSEDYKERFKAEYYQLKIRTKSLEQMLDKLQVGELDFKPKCTYNILHTQYVFMKQYENSLKKRARIEGIKL